MSFERFKRVNALLLCQWGKSLLLLIHLQLILKNKEKQNLVSINKVTFLKGTSNCVFACQPQLNILLPKSQTKEL